MGKIYIKSVLKSDEDVHIFEGKGIINENKITYNDNGVMTKVILGESISVERISDYTIKMNFKAQEKIDGTYNTSEGSFALKTDTDYILYEKNGIKIKYRLMINNVLTQTFEFNLQYTIDI